MNARPTQAARADDGPNRFLLLVPNLYAVALLALLGAILIIGLAPRLDTDLWWHLKDGAYIATHHSVPSRDFMSFTARGHVWTDHEWLAELLLYGLYSLAGLWGPIVFFALVICATFLLVYVQTVRDKVHPVLALFVLAVAFMSSSASWGPRIQMMTLFFLACYGLLVQQFRQSRDARLLVALPLLMVLWANLHGGFALGLVFLAVTLGGECMNRVTSPPQAWSPRDLKLFGAALVADCAVTMINPNGFHQLLYPLKFVLPNAYTNLIEESASPNFHMPALMVFEVMVLILVISLYIGRSRLNWVHLGLIVLFTHLALSQARNVAVWAVVITPLLAHYAQATVPQLRAQFERLSYRSRPVEGKLGQVLNLVLLAMVLLVYLAEGTHFVNAAALRTAETDNYPTAAVSYMARHRLPPRVLTSYGWGGYLLWHLFPAYTDYMDSRADTLYDNAILQGYLSMYAGAPSWKRTLDAYRIGTILIEPGAPLAQLLATEPQWHLRFQDPQAVLYVRGP